MVTSESGPALERLRVLDLTGTIAGSYCTKLLADAGADVVKVEPPDGDPLRRRAPASVTCDDSALFGYLSRAKKSIVLDGPRAPAMARALAQVADVVVMDGSQPAAEGWVRPDLAERDDAIGVSLSPFGVDGPWAGRTANDLLLQALSSSVAGRGEKTGRPLAAGGDLTEWAAGVTAAVATLGALRQRARSGRGELVDVALLDAAVTIFNGFRAVSGQLATPPSPPRVIEVPSIEPSRDGWVGFCTLSAQQFSAFAEMIGAPEWATHPDFSRIDRRCEQASVIRPRIAAWTRSRTTAEIMVEAGSRRVPVAPVGNGMTAPDIGHLQERGVFRRDLTNQPRIPYRFSRTPQPEFGRVPPLGEESTAAVLDRWARAPAGAEASPADPRPLAGVRVFDMTSFWAGPMVGQILGAFGADVIKIESVQRPDGTRLATSYGITGDQVWERSPLYQAVNTNKRNLTLDLTSPEGRDLARRLLAHCDVLIENYVPNVAERFGVLDDLAPLPWWYGCQLGGCPGHGGTGPGSRRPWNRCPGWPGSPAFRTDHRLCRVAPAIPLEGCTPHSPRSPRSSSATAPAWDRWWRSRSWSPRSTSRRSSSSNYAAYGHLAERTGNRSASHAPHDIFPCAGEDSWIAIAVTSDEQWQTMRSLLNEPWAMKDRYLTAAGRLQHQDEIGEQLARWCSSRSAESISELLWPAGVPAAPVVLPHAVVDLPQLVARGFWQEVVHPALGRLRLPAFPARFMKAPHDFHGTPAPALGQHNEEILVGLFGLGSADLAALAEHHVVGTIPLVP